jgi:sec-independent protein translocase protein TatA
MGIGSTELLIILLIVLVLFGGSRIPQLMGGLGKGVREFRKGMSADEEKKEEKSDNKPQA